MSAFAATLDKAIHAIQLYGGRGELVERALEELLARAHAATAAGPLALRVASFGLAYKTAAVSPEGGRVPYLFRLYCDGVRELTLLSGIEGAETRALASSLATAPTAHDEEDLVTRLWRLELPHVRIYAADTLSEGVAVDADGELALSLTGDQRAFGASGGPEASQAFSADDLRLLRAKDGLGWVREASAPSRAEGKIAAVAQRLRASFSTPQDEKRFVAIALGAAQGAQSPSPLVLGYLDACLNSDGVATASLLAALGAAVTDQVAGAAELLGAALDAARMPRLAARFSLAPEAFAGAVDAARTVAPERLVALLAELPPGPAEEALRDQLHRADIDLTAYYCARSTAADEAVALDAVRALGKLAPTPARTAVARALGHGSAQVRRAALELVAERYDPEARTHLGRLLKDPDRALRALALKALERSGDPRAAVTLLAILEDPAFERHDIDEQKLFYRALARFHEPQSIDHLRKVLHERSVARGRTETTRQFLAIGALTALGSPEARAVLAEVRGRWYLAREVKDAVEVALTRMRAP